MARISSGIAIQIPTGREVIAPAPEAPRRGAGAAIELPIRFAGRARFAIDSEDAARAFEAALCRAARPDVITEDLVREYCRQCGKPDYRMEWALLKEAFHVVPSDLLVDRLTATVRRLLASSAAEEIDIDALATGEHAARGGTLTGAFRGMAGIENGVLLVRCSLGSAIEPPVAIDLALLEPSAFGPRPATGPRELPVGGALRVEGAFTPRHRDRTPLEVRAQWRLPRGSDAPLARSGAPLDRIVGHIAATALTRFTRLLPRYLAALAHTDRGPAFVQLERVLRLGRMSERSRIYLLYWRRLRDYLLWRVSTGSL